MKNLTATQLEELNARLDFDAQQDPCHLSSAEIEELWSEAEGFDPMTEHERVDYWAQMSLLNEILDEAEGFNCENPY
jgi:hypothetical protein